jgi:hypothetical protein
MIRKILNGLSEGMPEEFSLSANERFGRFGEHAHAPKGGKENCRSHPARGPGVTFSLKSYNPPHFLFSVDISPSVLVTRSTRIPSWG